MAIAKIILYYSDRCGFCQKMKEKNGPWNQITSEVPEGIEVEEVDVESNPNTQYMDGGAVPQLVLVRRDGSLGSREIGYDPKVAKKVLALLAKEGIRRGDSCARGGFRQGNIAAFGRTYRGGDASPRKSGRRKSGRTKAPVAYTLNDLVYHVNEHCKHKKCQKNVYKALQCAENCCFTN